MSASVASDLDAPRPSHRRGAEKAAIVAAKLLVTAACFWYASRQIDWRQVSSAIPLLEFRWAALAVFVIMLEIPLVGLRWYNIVDALAARDQQMTRTAMTAATAVGLFFAQVLPNVAGEGMRAWLLVRLGSNWRTAVTSVVIDRGVGVGLLIVVGFVVLLLPSGLTALGGYRDVVLIVYGALILVGALGLARTENCVAACSVAIFPLARNVGRGFPSCFARIEGARGPEHCMSHRRVHHCRRLVARTRAGPRAAASRCDGPVRSHDRRGSHSDLDRRLGSARACRGLAPRRSWRRAGKGAAVFSVLWPRAGGWLSARSAGLDLVSIPVRSPFCCTRWVKGKTWRQRANAARCHPGTA